MKIPGFIKGKAKAGNKVAQAFVQMYDNGDNSPYDSSKYYALKEQMEGSMEDDEYENDVPRESDFVTPKEKSPQEQKVDERVGELAGKYNSNSKLNPAQTELLKLIDKYKDDYKGDSDLDTAFNEWYYSNIEIPKEWTDKKGLDYENLSDEDVEKYFDEEVWNDSFQDEVKKIRAGKSKKDNYDDRDVEYDEDYERAWGPRDDEDDYNYESVDYIEWPSDMDDEEEEFQKYAVVEKLTDLGFNPEEIKSVDYLDDFDGDKYQAGFSVEFKDGSTKSFGWLGDTSDEPFEEIDSDEGTGYNTDDYYEKEARKIRWNSAYFDSLPEDKELFIDNMKDLGVSLDDIDYVEPTTLENEKEFEGYEGGYDVYFKDGTIKSYGWKSEDNGTLEEIDIDRGSLKDNEYYDEDDYENDIDEENLPLAQKQALDLLQVSNSKYDDANKIQLEKSPKGNWILYYDGKNTGEIVGADKIDEESALKNGMIINSDLDDKNNEWEPTRDNIQKKAQEITNSFEMSAEEGWEQTDSGEKSFIKNKDKDNEMFIQYNGSDYDGGNQEWVAGYMKNGEYITKKFGNMEDAKGFLANVEPFEKQESAKQYSWKKLGDDWALFEKGKEPTEENAEIILSRMNRYFPWSVYQKGERNKDLESKLPSDNLSDIKDYLQGEISSSNKSQENDLIKERDLLWNKMPDVTKKEIQRLIEIRNLLGDDKFYEGK